MNVSSPLFDQNWEQVPLQTLDTTLPIVFCDVDGVINHLNKAPKWIGEGSPSSLDYVFMTSSNWAVEDLKIQDPEKQFEPDQETDLKMDRRNRDGLIGMEGFKPNFKTLNIRWSSDLVNKLSLLSKKTNFIWLTMWNAEAIRLLDPLWNISSKGFLGWKSKSDLGPEMKWDAILDFFVSMDQQNLDKPAWVWLEDDIIADRALSADPTYIDEKVNNANRLIIRTNDTWGIDREEIKLVEDFVHKNSANRE